MHMTDKILDRAIIPGKLFPATGTRKPLPRPSPPSWLAGTHDSSSAEFLAPGCPWMKMTTMRLASCVIRSQHCRWPVRTSVCARPPGTRLRLDESQQIGVDRVSLGSDHAVRKALVGLQRT